MGSEMMAPRRSMAIRPQWWATPFGSWVARTSRASASACAGLSAISPVFALLQSGQSESVSFALCLFEDESWWHLVYLDNSGHDIAWLRHCFSPTTLTWCNRSPADRSIAPCARWGHSVCNLPGLLLKLHVACVGMFWTSILKHMPALALNV